MSDRDVDLRRSYGKDVGGRQIQPYSRGLFPIPEYPEDEARGMWAETLGWLLTALRYLAPATLLTFFWGEHSVVFKLLRHLEASLRCFIFSSDAQTESVLRWVSEHGPVVVGSLEHVWQRGWILCALVERALPGACGGHRQTLLSIEHAQVLAEQYLGVQPVFSRKELESQESLSKQQEWRLADYLDRLRHALGRISPTVSKTNPPQAYPETQAYTLDYVARGIGLCAAQAGKRMCFKIYPTAQQCLEPGDINVLIRGPKDTYGTAVVQPLYGRAQLIKKTYLGLDKSPQYTERALPLTQGATYLRSFGKTNINNTFYIPKVKYDIDIAVSVRRDHVRVNYSADLIGIYEISLSSRGYHLIGSPFRVMSTEDTIEYNTSSDLDEDEECGILDVKNDRRIVFRIVDFVTEKMLLNENGMLVSITDEEAIELVRTAQNADNIQESDKCTEISNIFYKEDTKLISEHKRFQSTVKNIITMIKVCKKFMSNVVIQPLENSKNQYLDVPDIVNSMIFDKSFSEIKHNDVLLCDKIANEEIIEHNNYREITSIDNLSMTDWSLKNVKKYIPSTIKEADRHDILKKLKLTAQKHVVLSDSPQIMINENADLFKLENNCELKTESALRSSEPFVPSLTFSNYKTVSDYSEIVKIENTSPNNPFHKDIENERQNSLTQDNNSIQIVIETDDGTEVSNNPFINLEFVERPKTPILKIITGDIKDRDIPLYVHPETVINDGIIDEEHRKSNEYLNPFYLHEIHHSSVDTTSPTPPPVAEFLIGAPVSLTPFHKASSPEPDMNSIILACNLEEALQKYDNKVQNMNRVDSRDSTCESSMYYSPLPPSPNHEFEEPFSQLDIGHRDDSTLYSTESYANESTRNVIECSNRVIKLASNDLWDSAYVSIDETNNSPDSNNNSENHHKIRILEQGSVLLDCSDGVIFHMGPAEREIWQECSNISTDLAVSLEHEIHQSFNIKKITFPPIIEEGNKNLPNVADNVKSQEPDSTEHASEGNSITAALTELNDIYQEYLTKSESSSLAVYSEKEELLSLNVNYTMLDTNENVDSASEIVTDVKRRNLDKDEAAISEVQSLATESFSVSQALENTGSYPKTNATEKKSVTIFGQKPSGNLVIERKKYWDDKIKSIEENIQDLQEKNKKEILKTYGQNNSIKNTKGKCMTNILNESERTITSVDNISNENKHVCAADNESQNELKNVETWKKYWDEKLINTEETCDNFSYPRNNVQQLAKQSESTIKCDLIATTGSKYSTTQNKSDSVSPEEIALHPEIHSPIKHDITDEKVFKAFETSPKRFFGNSRKNILEKIDSFLTKANTEKKEVLNESRAQNNYGIVSNRVSMFNMHTKSMDLNESKKNARKKIQNQSSLNFDIKIHENTTLHNNDDTKLIEPEVSAQLDIDESERIPIEPVKVNKDIKKFRKLSASKSEMDIFNKVQNQADKDKLEIHKSCEELHQVNVRGFISMFESVTKTKTKDNNHLISRFSNPLIHPQSHRLRRSDDIKDESEEADDKKEKIEVCESIDTFQIKESIKHFTDESEEADGEKEKIEVCESIDTFQIKESIEHFTHTKSLDAKTINSQVNIEYDKSHIRDVENQMPNQKSENVDYKQRFKKAKLFFQSLEEIRNEEQQPKLNECEMMLYCQSTESLPQLKKTTKIKTVRAYSAPTSDCEYEAGSIGDQWEGYGTGAGGRKLIKISEKFQVDDLFNDVAGEGKLSRQGSFRGIPHKHAVLAAFKSMENVTDSSPYEMSVSQLSDFAKENKIKVAQTYLTEYPYLPRTEPSMYRSRVDSQASGLISRKELLKYNTRPRRNSVPDALRLNERFTATL